MVDIYLEGKGKAMLRYDKMTFDSRRLGGPQGAAEVIGELRVVVGRLMTENEKLLARDAGPILEERVKEGLRLDAWRLAYGELQGPVRELIQFARIYVRPEDQGRVRELEAQILRAIAPPSPLPGSTEDLG